MRINFPVVALLLLAPCAQAQEYFSWNGQSFATLAAAEDAMRNHPGNAAVKSNLNLCEKPVDIPGATIYYKYCVGPKAVELVPGI